MILGANGPFTKTTNINLSFALTGWTNMTYAAYYKDFDALHQLVVYTMKNVEVNEEGRLGLVWQYIYEDLPQLGRELNIRYIQLPIETLDWFRFRGL